MENDEILKLDSILFYRDGQLSLNDISMSVKKGENLVIFGPENSGAEIICELIALTEDKFGGEIYYKGKAIKSFDYVEKHNYRKELGYLQKSYGLINNMSVEENISLPLRYHSELSMSAIKLMVDGLIDQMHLGYCKNLRPVDLSGAEILKTVYIRAIALDPDLLLIEHVLEGQCLFNSQTFLNKLKNWALQEDKSVIITTYEPERFIDFSNRFIMLYNGDIVFMGNRDEFINKDNDYLRQYMNSSLEGPMKIE
jgi:ABC-type transporter Mla maintaining outer membrane lipid asymmetry ATPase subunit MlaF